MSTAIESPPIGIVPLAPRTIILVQGNDRLRFINGQITNDVRMAEEGTCIYTAILNAKGQLDGVCHLRAIPDAYLIDAPFDLQEALLSRLDRYLIADDVTLTDVSSQWHLYHLLGISPEQAKLPDDAVAHENNRYGEAGWDALTQSPLEIDPAYRIPSEALDRFRIQQGIPQWPSELTPGLLPPEAGLDANAISYEKGCYLGQEVISRMKRAGKTNRHLILLEVPSGTAPGPLFSGDLEAGVITSVASVTDGSSSTLALGFRKRKFETLNEFTLSGTDQPAKTLRRIA